MRRLTNLYPKTLRLRLELPTEPEGYMEKNFSEASTMANQAIVATLLALAAYASLQNRAEMIPGREKKTSEPPKNQSRIDFQRQELE